MFATPYDAAVRCVAWFLFMLGCSTPTQVIVYFSADPGVAGRADAFQIRVFNDDLAEVSDRAVRFGPTLPRLDVAPAVITLVPEGEDATRRFLVVGSLLDASADEIVRRDVIGSYVLGERREIRVHLDDACALSSRCPVGRTCDLGACVSPCVAVSTPGATARAEPVECSGCYGVAEGGDCSIDGNDGRCWDGSCCPGCWNPDGPIGERCRLGQAAALCGAAGAVCADCSQGGDTCGTGGCSPVLRAPSIEAGRAHTCASASGEGLYCWGHNERGQLGNGSTEDSCAAVRVAEPTDTFGLGVEHTCASHAPAGLTCWGPGVIDRRLAFWFGTDFLVPPPPNPARQLSDLGLGLANGCGLEGGSLYCWGGTYTGALADPHEIDVLPEPTRLGPRSDWHSIAAQGQVTCGIAGDPGELYCWGLNEDGGVGAPLAETLRGRQIPFSFMTRIGAPERDWTQVSVGRFGTCAIDRSGALACFGLIRRCVFRRPAEEPKHELVELGGGPWDQVSVGYTHVCAIDRERRLFCGGEDPDGRLGAGPDTVPGRLLPSGPVGWRWRDVALGQDHTCAVRDDFTVHCWGSGTRCATADPSMGSSFDPIRVYISPSP